jgi:hypothetical protein
MLEKLKDKFSMPDMKDMLELQKAMEAMMPLMEKLGILLEVMPKFEVQHIKLAGKSYIAILFERPPKQEPPKQEAKPSVS